MANVETWGWSDTFQQLIDAGHTWADIQHYTLAQVEFFGKAVDRSRIRQEKTALIIARAAQYDAESYDKFLKERPEYG